MVHGYLTVLERSLGARVNQHAAALVAVDHASSQVGFGAFAVHSNPATQVIVVVAVPVRV
eukprot:CAMPEP_0182552260 /NCGR_PEP_ID=MMETSP1323-20130603/47771_1 /TAXON_ID=236787 /ORGANISM="Florenciella parvula, Strain RCC1693" /LENGTH=59 /DNA_ID=CAMNT_0024763939 /DNA_START=128 /DNA_END=303 /DNA_ORIENTATION=-